MAGYSGTPLPKKLGIKDNFRVFLDGAPSAVLAELKAPLSGCDASGSDDECQRHRVDNAHDECPGNGYRERWRPGACADHDAAEYDTPGNAHNAKSKRPGVRIRDD